MLPCLRMVKDGTENLSSTQSFEFSDYSLLFVLHCGLRRYRTLEMEEYLQLRAPTPSGAKPPALEISVAWLARSYSCLAISSSSFCLSVSLNRIVA